MKFATGLLGLLLLAPSAWATRPDQLLADIDAEIRSLQKAIIESSQRNGDPTQVTRLRLRLEEKRREKRTLIQSCPDCALTEAKVVSRSGKRLRESETGSSANSQDSIPRHRSRQAW